MGIYQEKYTREYFTGVNKDGNPVGYGALQEKDDEGLWVLRSHDRKILESIDFTDKHVLDLGFGRGEAICYAYQNGAAHCVGVDFSEAAVDLSKELIAKRQLPEAQLICSDALTFIQKYGENIGDPNNTQFDVVLMLDFVEHIPRKELGEMFESLKKIITSYAIIVINTPEYKYDNDVVQNGYDDRNMDGCTDTSDIVPETKGMHCNKYTVVSLQDFMSAHGFLNITEAHFYAARSLFEQNNKMINLSAYSERWRFAQLQQVPIKSEYTDDKIEFPYTTSENPSYITFEQGNLSGLTFLVTKTFQDSVFPAGNYDAELFSALKQEEIENKVIYEVGAFMGVNSLLFAKLSSPNGRVIAFEPNPWNRNRMFLNLSHNQGMANRILVYDFALGVSDGQTTMTMSSELDNGYSSTSRIKDSHPKIQNQDLPPGFIDMVVNTQTLDSFVESTSLIPDVIKMDIEGAEYFLLRGGLKTLHTYHPILFIELHSEFCALQCSILLQDLGYEILVIKEELDNRLMIKAVSKFQFNQKSQISIQNRNSDAITDQYEIVRQLQRFYEKELSAYHTLQTEYKELQTKYLEAVAMDETTKSELESKQQELKALQTEHELLQAKSQHLHEEHNGLLTEYETLQSNTRRLQELLNGFQKEHESLISKSKLMQEEFDGLRKEHESLKSDYQGLLIRTSELKSELQGAQTELTSLLSTKSIRFIKKIKAILVGIGVRKTY